MRNAGSGLYSEQKFFGIIHKGRLYFKTSESTRADYIDRGMKPFQPNRRQTLYDYYEVPGHLLDDAESLSAWACRAISLF